MKPRAVVVALLALLSACSRLGLGEQGCEPHVRVPSPANILAAQSVPSARYTPCFVSIDPGWDHVEFEAESGKAGIAIVEGTDTFLAAVVTESCDVGGAVRTESGHPDIERFEDVVHVPSRISVAVVPVGPGELSYAIRLIDVWQGVELEDRPVALTLDDDTTADIAQRLSHAMISAEFVWLIDDLDVAEGTVELRTAAGQTFSRITPTAALNRIEDLAPKPSYTGNWYFTFEGGCITYIFNAEKRMADQAPVVADEKLGFYPAFELWEQLEISSR